MRHLEGGGVVANFTLATSERFRDKSGLLQERTEWHNIVCWGPSADRAEKFVKKGTQLYIEGKIRTRSYDAKDGSKRYVTEIYADVMQLLGRKGDNPASAATGTQASPAAPQFTSPAAPSFETPADLGGTETDDLPF